VHDSTVAANVEKTIEEAVRFLKARRFWLQPTRYDWSDVHLRAKAQLSLDGLRWHYPDTRLTVVLRPEIECNLPTDVRDYLCAQLAELPLLPRGRGRYQRGAYAPRNIAIVQAIRLVISRGFNPTRSGEDVKSACGITKIALERLGIYMEEGTINEIWFAYDPVGSP
jgi:hypothetical protein